MKEPSSSRLFGARRSRRPSTVHSCPQSKANAFPAGNRYLSPNQWIYAVNRLSVYRQPDGSGLVNLFETSTRSPMLFDLADLAVLQSEIDLRREALPRGIYRFAELEILWFSAAVTLFNPEKIGEKNPEVPLKIFVADIPELGVQHGDVQIKLEGQDYWIAPDWRTLFSDRPEKPLSAIMLTENQPLGSGERPQSPAQYLSGGHFRVRLTLPYPVVADRRIPRKHPPRVPHLKLCQPSPSSISS